MASNVVGEGVPAPVWTCTHSTISSSGMLSPFRSTNLPITVGVTAPVLQSAHRGAMAGSAGAVDRSVLPKLMSGVPKEMSPLVLT